jgi:hypothetical protein
MCLRRRQDAGGSGAAPPCRCAALPTPAAAAADACRRRCRLSQSWRGASSIAPHTWEPHLQPACSSVQKVIKDLEWSMEQVGLLKLHRPVSAYTGHPLWRELSAPQCSFAETCRLLAGGLAAEFVEAPPPPDSEDAHAQSSGSSGDTWSGRSMPEAPPQHQSQQGPCRAARWLEYPAGSKQYVTLISQRAVRKRAILLPGEACSPGRPALHVCPSGGRSSLMVLHPTLSSVG